MPNKVIAVSADHATGGRSRASAMHFVVASARRLLTRGSWRSVGANQSLTPQVESTATPVTQAPLMESAPVREPFIEVGDLPARGNMKAAENPVTSDLRLSSFDSAARAGVENLRIRSQVLLSVG